MCQKKRWFVCVSTKKILNKESTTIGYLDKLTQQKKDRYLSFFTVACCASC